MRAANESYALKMNIIVILLGNDIKPDVPAKREVSDVDVKLSLAPHSHSRGVGTHCTPIMIFVIHSWILMEVIWNEGRTWQVLSKKLKFLKVEPF